MSVVVPSTGGVSAAAGSDALASETAVAAVDVPAAPVGTLGAVSLVVVSIVGGGAPVVSVWTGTFAKGSAAGFAFFVVVAAACGSNENELVTTGTRTVRACAAGTWRATACCFVCFVAGVPVAAGTLLIGAACAGRCNLGIERTGNATAGTAASGIGVTAADVEGRSTAIAAGLAYMVTMLRVPTAASQYRTARVRSAFKLTTSSIPATATCVRTTVSPSLTQARSPARDTKL